MRGELEALAREAARLRAEIARAEGARSELVARIEGERRSPWGSPLTYAAFAVALTAGGAAGPAMADRAVRAEIESTLGVPDRPCAVPPMPSDTAISLERTGCDGGCREYIVTLYANGQVDYAGTSAAGGVEHRTERVDPAIVKGLYDRTMRACFATVHDEYPVPTSHLPTAFVTVYGGGASKRVRHYPSWYGARDTSPALPQCWAQSALASIERDIDGTARVSRWVGESVD